MGRCWRVGHIRHQRVVLLIVKLSLVFCSPRKKQSDTYVIEMAVTLPAASLFIVIPSSYVCYVYVSE